MNSIITLTTDLGDQFAVAQLHAVLASDGFDGRVIENHSVTSFSILEGAFEIDALARFTLAGTVHVGVVDPGVGSDRKGIVVKTENFWFVGPDNGLLYPAAVRDGIRQVWQLDELAFPNVTNTFHGRDVFIRAAVKLSRGDHPEIFGCSLTSPTSLTLLTFHPGQVVHVDHYGNLKVIWENGIHVGSSLCVRVSRMNVASGHSGVIPSPSRENDRILSGDRGKILSLRSRSSKTPSGLSPRAIQALRSLQARRDERLTQEEMTTRSAKLICVKKNGTSHTIPVVKTFSDVPAGSPLALLGSNGTLELAVNLGRGDEYFGVQLGDILRIRSFEKDLSGRSDP